MNPLPRHTELPSPVDLFGFRLGWDHARLGLSPAATPATTDAALIQGWRVARSVLPASTADVSRHARRWLALRAQARAQHQAFDEQHLTPAYLAELEQSHCPITRKPLGGARHNDEAAEFVSLDPSGWAAGRVLMVSRAAARALAGASVDSALRAARQAELGAQFGEVSLDARSWRRLASLLAFVQGGAHEACAARPATLLPPHRLQVRAAAHGLQACLSWQLARPGWSRRLRELADTLPGGQAREEFLLWMGAVTPRVLELPPIASGPTAMRHALEDLWLDARVQQRWQHFLLTLGERGTQALLARAVSAGGPGVRPTDAPMYEPSPSVRHLPREGAPPQALVSCLRRPARRHARRAAAPVVHMPMSLA